MPFDIGYLGSAGPDGRLSGSFTAPARGSSPTCFAVWAIPTGSTRGVAGTGAVMSGNTLTPRACELLPRYPLQGDGVPITLSPAQPAAGVTLELSGKGLTGPQPVASGLQAFRSVLFGGSTTAVAGQGEADAVGNFCYTLTLPPDPALSGRCVALTVQRTDVGNPGYPIGYVEFNYP